MDNENLKGIDDYINILKRRKWQLIIPALLLMLISAVVAYSLPSVYQSEAVILIEQQQIPSDLVRSTVTSYAGERIQVISQRVMTSDNLGKIIDQFGLYRDQREKEGLSILIDKLRDEIELEMVSAETGGRNTKGIIAFRLSFMYKDPRIAQKVVNELVSLYLNENLKRRTQSALETYGFLGAEADRLQREVEQLESKLADFKQQNINNLPEHQKLNIQLMQRSESDLAQINQNIQLLEERRIYLSTELSQLSALGKESVKNQNDLAVLEKEYAQMSAQYTDNHPYMVMLIDKISALRENKLKTDVTSAGTQLEMVGRASDNVKNDPAYLQIQREIKETVGELAILKQSRIDISSKIEDFEKRLMQSPQVEREYNTLTRDYDNAQSKFKEVKAKQMEAKLAESLERESKGERFSLIEPPRIAEEPAKPNRKLILFLGFVFSLTTGLGHMAVREGLDKTIRSRKDVSTITEAPILAVIPYIHISDDKQKVMVSRVVVGIGIITLIVIALFALHYYSSL